MRPQTTTINITPDRMLDDILLFFPPGIKAAVLKIVSILEHADVRVDGYVDAVAELGSNIITSGLDSTIDGLERMIESIYERGWMDSVGNVNAFARDGLEIGIELTLNLLKALTPGDVAKVIGLVLVLWLAPNLLWLNGAAFLEIVTELGTRLWMLP